jgi:hypothetical protein
MKGLFRRTDGVQQIPLGPQRKAAIRQLLLWTSISYIPLLGGLAWAFFATRHWAGSRGVFLSVSGVMIGVAASSALFFPVLRLVNPKLRLMGMSVAGYTYVSISLAIAIAAVLAVAAFAIPQK